MHIHQNNSTLHAQSLNDIAKPPAILVAGLVTFFRKSPPKITFCLFQLPNCGHLQQRNPCRKMCRRKIRRNYNSSVLRPWRDLFGRPSQDPPQTRHPTRPQPGIFLILVETPDLSSVHACFSSKLRAKHVNHTHVKMATLMHQKD